MQNTRPQTILAPLQLGLGVQMHRQFGSKFLIDSFYGIYGSAALSGVGIPGSTNNDHFMRAIADNVDHNARTIDGKNTFHGMGIIFSVTPKVKTSNIIPRITNDS